MKAALRNFRQALFPHDLRKACRASNVVIGMVLILSVVIALAKANVFVSN
ncbi:hypothetical protein [Rhizobium sp. NFR03]|nr:hypothetical protein [Rhizobium sp. NFR03]SES39067.1 hypothetical protein SAMN03159406_03915 [Rhizobium sp. NFR03]